MNGHVTLAQVAAQADVSLATASRALNGSAGRTVRPELAERVHHAAATLGYSVNRQAQSMARGRSSTVGLIVHDIADPHAAALASGVMAAAADHGLIVTIASAASDPALERRHLEALRQQRARAVILAGSQSLDPDSADTTDTITAMVTAGMHLAVIGRNRLGVNTLEIANYDGASDLAHTLYSLGYRRLAILAGPEDLATSDERVRGFRAGMGAHRAEVQPENIISAAMTRDGGYAAMTELLDRALDVDCVFAVNDVMALGAMAALREQGYRIPDDVALAGFGGIAPLRDVTPSLTTVDIPLVQIGRDALALALEADPAAVPLVRRITVDVAVRASTPPRR